MKAQLPTAEFGGVASRCKGFGGRSFPKCNESGGAAPEMRRVRGGQRPPGIFEGFEGQRPPG